MAKRTLLIWEESPGNPTAIKFDAVLSITHEGVTEVTEHPVEVGSDIADHARPNNRRLQIEGLVSNTPSASNTDTEVSARFPGAIIVPTQPNDFLDTGNQNLDLGAPPEYRERSRKLDIPAKPVKFGNPVGQVIDAFQGSAVGVSADLLERRGTQAKSGKAFLLSASDFQDRVKEIFEALERARVESHVLRVETRLVDYNSMVIESVSVPRTAQDGNSATFQIALREIRIVNAKTVEAPEPAEPLGFVPQARGSQNKKEDPEEKDDNKKRSLLRKAAEAGLNAIGDLF